MSHKEPLDYVNGVSILLPEIQDILMNAKLSRKDRAILTSIAYLLKSVPPLRQDVDTIKETIKEADLPQVHSDLNILKSNDWFGVAKKHPKIFMLLICILYLFLISPVREAVIQFLGEIMQVAIKVL